MSHAEKTKKIEVPKQQKKVRLTTKQKNTILAEEGKILRLHGEQVRLYPTADQALLICQSVGCARYIYNQYIALHADLHHSTGQTLKGADFKKHMNHYLKNEYPWLRVPDKYALETAAEYAEEAFKKFLNKESGYPQFKSKHTSQQSYTTKSTNNNVRIEGNRLILPKLGSIKFRGKLTKHFTSDARILKATVTISSTGTYTASLTIERTVALEAPIPLQDLEQKVQGYDLGLLEYLIDSKGNKVPNPRFLQRALNRLKNLQKNLSRSERGSNNYAKKVRRLAKYHQYIANLRKDFLHKLSRQLINDNQVNVYVFEDLNIKGMVKNHRLAKSIQDAGWHTFLTFMSYKAQWAGKKVIYVDRFFASSKRCSHCGVKHIMLTLNDREWACNHCGTIHDRDVNAAVNIKREGIRLLLEKLV